MEIAPLPHRPPPRERRWLVAGLVVLVPVVLLVLLPAAFGLDRHVVTDDSMGGSMGRGSVVFARVVPAGDLRAGDVISYASPHQAGHPRVTRRIVSLDGGHAVTRGDAADGVDPIRLDLTQPTYARVLFHVPWIGYPFLFDGGLLLLAAASVILAFGALVVGRRQVRYRRVLEQGRALPPKGASARPRVPVV